MRRAALLLVALALAGCGGSGGGASVAPRASVSGTWVGSYVDSYIDQSGQKQVFTETVTMALIDNAGVVSGAGTFGTSSFTSAETFSGTFSDPNLTLTVHATGEQDAVLTGTVSGRTITGALNGSGYVNQAISFTRQ